MIGKLVMREFRLLISVCLVLLPVCCFTVAQAHTPAISGVVRCPAPSRNWTHDNFWILAMRIPARHRPELPSRRRHRCDANARANAYVF